MNPQEVFASDGVREVMLRGGIWYIAKDAAEALGFQRPGNAIAAFVHRPDTDIVLIPGKYPNTYSNVIVINEAGFRRLKQYQEACLK